MTFGKMNGPLEDMGSMIFGDSFSGVVSVSSLIF